MPDNSVVGRYELVERISVGGMGTVWRGYDAVLDRPVAVKLIRPDRLVEPEQAEDFARRFRREARVTARIGHHGVPQVYDAVLTPPCDRVYLVMELIRGTNLRTYITRGVPLPVAWAVAIAAQIATVLSYAHAVPVVHRDLKPENVLITPDGALKVLDFGIAAILGTGTTKITATGYPVGTSRYMSPEQIRGAQVTPQSDLYALGCVLYELLCGRSVFDGRSDYALWQQHTSAAPRPPRSVRPSIPGRLEQLVLDLLEKTPERRPADARAVYKGLTPFLPPSGTLAPAVDGRLVTLPDPTRPYRRPNAPRPLPGSTDQADEPLQPLLESTDAAPFASLRDAIKQAIDQSVGLLREERFSQAAEVLQEAIVPAADALGTENPHVLKLRARRAAILIRGGAARRALPEFDALAAAYARTGEESGPETLRCRRQAAHCRAELGRTSEALEQFRDILDHVAAQEGTTSPTALDLRRNIGVLLLADDDEEAAAEILAPLYLDLAHVLGPVHEETREVADLLARLRLSDHPHQSPGA